MFLPKKNAIVDMLLYLHAPTTIFDARCVKILFLSSKRISSCMNNQVTLWINLPIFLIYDPFFTCPHSSLNDVYEMTLPAAIKCLRSLHAINMHEIQVKGLCRYECVRF